MSIWSQHYAIDQDFDGIAWDCDPSFAPDYESDYDDLNDLDDYPKQDWQVIALDRFGDRLINGSY